MIYFAMVALGASGVSQKKRKPVFVLLFADWLAGRLFLIWIHHY